MRALVAVAWADGRMEAAEAGVIEGLLSGFDATPEEEAEILAFARHRRTLESDVPVAELSTADRELLFSNAALHWVDAWKHRADRDPDGDAWSRTKVATEHASHGSGRPARYAGGGHPFNYGQ